MPGTGPRPFPAFLFARVHLMLIAVGAVTAEHSRRPKRYVPYIGLAEKDLTMRYRVFSGPIGSGPMSPFEKERLLFKEFDSLDGALAWARHLQEQGRVALAIDGDDGTSLTKQEIAAALRHSENERISKAS
jgi:hypothetical protein